MHVDEDLAEPAVLVFAGVQVDLVAADGRLLRVALAPVGELLALLLPHVHRALDDLLDDPLRSGSRAQRGRLVGVELLGCLLLLVGVIGEELGVERLAQLGAVAVERVGLQRQAPGQQVALLQSSTVASFGMLIVLEIAPEMNGCDAAIMRMWLSTDR